MGVGAGAGDGDGEDSDGEEGADILNIEAAAELIAEASDDVEED